MDEPKQESPVVKNTLLHLDMKPTLRQWFTQNLLWKALAMVAAVLLWIVAMGQNQIVTTPMTRPVELRGLDVLAQHDIALLNENSLRSLMVVQVSRRQDTHIQADELQVFIDFAQLPDLDQLNTQGFVSLPVQSEINSLTVDGGYMLSPSQATLNAHLDRIEVFTVPIELVVTDTPAGNYSYGNMVPNHEFMVFSAPTSIGKSIAQAVASINLEGVTSHLIASVPVNLLSGEGELITSPHIQRQFDNLHIDIPIASLSTVPVLEPTLVGSEQVALGTRFEGLSMDMHLASVFGDAHLVAQIQELHLPELDITGRDSTFVHSVNLNTLLPPELTLRGSHTVNVTVVIEAILPPEPVQAVLFELPAHQLSVVGELPADHHLMFEPLIIELLGDTVDTSLITAHLYLPELLTLGEHHLPVVVHLPEQLLASPVYASLYVTLDSELATFTPFTESPSEGLVPDTSALPYLQGERSND